MAPAVGLEGTKPAENKWFREGLRTEESTRTHVSARTLVATGPAELQTTSVEDALADAISKASAAGRWDVVAQLARELEARRLDAAGVECINGKRGVK